MLHNLRFFFPLQNAVYFIMLLVPCLVPVLFAFYLWVCSNLNVKFRLQKVNQVEQIATIGLQTV